MIRTAAFTALFLVLLATLGQTQAPLVSQTVDGSLSRSSPRWDRIRDSGSTIDPNCGATAPDSYNDGVPYAVFALRSETTQDLELNVTGQAGSLFDPFVALYCAPFSARNPSAGLIAANDDGGGYPAAAIETGDGITLVAGTTYYLVVTSYSTFAPYGDFRLDIVTPGIQLKQLRNANMVGLWLLLED